MRSLLRSTVVLLLAFLLPSCALVQVGRFAAEEVERGEVAPSDEVVPADADEDSTAEAPQPPVFTEPTACAPEVTASVDAVVRGQLDAFVADDFAAALEYATPGFRTSFDEATFRSMITTNFPIPATATGHSVQDCLQDGPAVITTIVIRSDQGTQAYTYGLELVDDEWLIGGAVPQDGTDSQTI